jgi:hypothetical protein
MESLVTTTSDEGKSLSRSETEEDQKSHVHKMLRRFHTDKFLPKYRTRMEGMDSEQQELAHDNLKSLPSTAAEFLRFLRENSEIGTYFDFEHDSTIRRAR